MGPHRTHGCVVQRPPTAGVGGPCATSSPAVAVSRAMSAVLPSDVLPEPGVPVAVDLRAAVRPRATTRLRGHPVVRVTPCADSAAGMQERDGLEAFLRAQQPVLVGYLCRRVPEEDAKDIAQEAFVRMLRYRDHPRDQLKALMYRIATNVLLDRARRDRSRGAPLHVSLDADHDAMASDEPAHEERVESQQALAQVRAAILQLPGRCREVYLLNRIEGMSYTEIARHCGISVKAVEKNIGRALRVLRERLAPHQRPGGEP